VVANGEARGTSWWEANVEAPIEEWYNHSDSARVARAGESIVTGAVEGVKSGLSGTDGEYDGAGEIAGSVVGQAGADLVSPIAGVVMDAQDIRVAAGEFAEDPGWDTGGILAMNSTIGLIPVVGATVKGSVRAARATDNALDAAGAVKTSKLRPDNLISDPNDSNRVYKLADGRQAVVPPVADPNSSRFGGLSSEGQADLSNYIRGQVEHTNQLSGLTYNGRNIAPQVDGYVKDTAGNVVGYVRAPVEGRTLTDLAESGDLVNLSDAQFGRIETQIRGQVGVLNKAGFVHGDLNSSNILVDSGGNVHLTGFHPPGNYQVAQEASVVDRVVHDASRFRNDDVVRRRTTDLLRRERVDQAMQESRESGQRWLERYGIPE